MEELDKNTLFKKLPWDGFYRDCQNFALQFVDNQKCLRSTQQHGDEHTITTRLVRDDIPKWIRRRFLLKISHLQIFACEPNAAGYIHKDGMGRQSALNIPIVNTDNSTLEWFDSRFSDNFLQMGDYTTLVITRDEIRDGKYVGLPNVAEVMDTPCIVNTSVWHRVNNRHNDKFRWMLSIRFRDNPTFNDMITNEFVRYEGAVIQGSR